MLQVLLLVCSTAIPRLECQIDTARTVLVGPDAINEVACAMQSQAYFASSAIELADDEYLKILCRRTGIGKGNVG